MNAFFESSSSDRDADCASSGATAQDTAFCPEERATLLAELDAARRTAASCIKQRDELLSAIAHDLRGPLNSIVGWIQLLQSGRLDSTQQTRALEAIIRGSNAQTRLIDSLQDISRALPGKLQLTPSRLDAGAPLQAAIDAITERAAAKNVEVKAEIEPGIPVIADTLRLRQLFDHLLDNAVRCTPQGGTISIELTRDRGSAWIRIADNGIGIDAAELPHVFEPFRRREEPAGRSAGRGLGVGLALSQQIATLHGGSIEAYSRGHGHGSLFIVRLPVAADPSIQQSPRDDARAFSVSRPQGISRHSA